VEFKEMTKEAFVGKFAVNRNDVGYMGIEERKMLKLFSK
jgi:hypothetical protein